MSGQRRILGPVLWLTLTLALPAAAQTPVLQGFDANQLAPLPNRRDDPLGVSSSRLLGPWEVSATALVGYARNLLVELDPEGGRARSLVKDQVVMHLLAAIGFYDWVELGIDVPMVLTQGGDTTSDLSGLGAGQGFGMGDIRASLKVRLLPQSASSRAGLALQSTFFIPSGDPERFLGGGFSAEPRVVFDWTFAGGARLMANVGWRFKQRAELGNLTVDDTLTYGLGADIPFGAFHLVPELGGGISVLGKSFGLDAFPLEARVGGKLALQNGFLADATLGMGLLQGFGTPDVRFLVGVGWASPSRETKDSDGDGLVDAKDKCPTRPEDPDGVEDEDGCPEEDAVVATDDDPDRDGVRGAADQCPNTPEDADGFQDDDGCPDLDDDLDGVPDATDRCPRLAEDRDGFADDDGCPDPDNDQDGILDRADQCPNAPEVLNGVDDEDGCPDEGGDFEVTCQGVVFEHVFFKLDSDTLQVASLPLLDQLAKVLDAAPYIKQVRIEGHTDNLASEWYNLRLSQRRADSVRRYLLEKGIAAQRLEAQGFGFSKPVTDNDSEAGRSKNRRVAFVITKQNRCKQAPEGGSP